MILWINGAFGAGKTTAAEILHEKLPNSYIFDPEDIGTCIREAKPASLWRDDFQDYPSWREMTCCLLRELHESCEGTVIVPMTVTDPAYFDETIGRLEREGLPILHIVLLAGRERLLERLLGRGEEPDSWSVRQIGRCAAALGSAVRGIEIGTDHRAPQAVAEEILSYMKTWKEAEPCGD